MCFPKACLTTRGVSRWICDCTSWVSPYTRAVPLLDLLACLGGRGRFDISEKVKCSCARAHLVRPTLFLVSSDTIVKCATRAQFTQECLRGKSLKIREVHWSHGIPKYKVQAHPVGCFLTWHVSSLHHHVNIISMCLNISWTLFERGSSLGENRHELKQKFR